MPSCHNVRKRAISRLLHYVQKYDRINLPMAQFFSFFCPHLGDTISTLKKRLRKYKTQHIKSIAYFNANKPCLEGDDTMHNNKKVWNDRKNYKK